MGTMSTIKQPPSYYSDRVTAGLLALAFVACGGGNDDDGTPVSHSAPVGINLKIKPDDAAKTGTAQAEKNINTESGNPYAKFIADARTRLARDPGRIEVASVKLQLGAGSKGLTALDQAVIGNVELLFLMNDTNNSFKVAETKDPKGAGPVNMTVSFDPKATQGADFAKLVSGNFKVVLRAPAAPGFTGKKDLDADLQVTFEFVAFP